MADPTTLTLDQLRAAYEALGLDPADWSSTALIQITPHKATVVRYEHNDEGHIVAVDGAPVTVITTIPLGPTETEGMTVTVDLSDAALADWLNDDAPGETKNGEADHG